LDDFFTKASKLLSKQLDGPARFSNVETLIEQENGIVRVPLFESTNVPETYYLCTYMPFLMFPHRGLISEPLKFPQMLGVLAIRRSQMVGALWPRPARWSRKFNRLVRPRYDQHNRATRHITDKEDRYSPTDFVLKAVLEALRGLAGCSYYTISEKWRPQNKHSIDIQLQDRSFYGAEIFNDRIDPDVEWR
jgi:hypothetical protein